MSRPRLIETELKMSRPRLFRESRYSLIWTWTFGLGLLDLDFWTFTFTLGLLDLDFWTLTFGLGLLDLDFWTRTFGLGLVEYLYEGYFAVPWWQYSVGGN